MTDLNSLRPAQLRRAADIQERILNLQKELTEILGVTPEAPAPASTARTRVSGRRRLSPQGLANIRAGVARRWGQVKGTAASLLPQKPKRKMSAAGRAAISAAARARWAKAKRAGKNRL